MHCTEARRFMLALANNLARSAAGASRGRLGRGLMVLLGIALVFVPQPVLAGTIQFFEVPGGTGGILVTGTISTLSISSPSANSVKVGVGSPQGFDTLIVSAFRGGTVGEPGGGPMSDRFDLSITAVDSSAEVDVTFTFDQEVPGGLGPCPIGGCDIIEDTSIHTLVTIEWRGPNGLLESDTFQFQGDVDARASVPEPGSLLLLEIGLAGLVGVGWRARGRR